MKANIFNIQKSSIQDGPGVRTVVFFKGCPLRCPWCSHPESQSHPTELLWDRKKCFYGHLCEIHCPAGCLSFKNGVLHSDLELCTGCFNCITQCPTKALEFAGKLMEPGEVMQEILTDKKKYEESGGGVTLSGGEVLNQPEFAIELLKECHEQGIHTSVETSGYASPLVFSRVARHSDLLIFVIHHHDNGEHIRFTGVSQGKILENLDAAVSMKIPAAARIPVVPGVNNTLTDAGKFAALLKDHQITRVILVPYMLTGDRKYEILPPGCHIKGQGYPSGLEEYASVFAREGFEVSL